MKSEKIKFGVKPRIFQLLGDQLIRDANLAVFELVKNAYDADATSCSILLEYPDEPSKARIEIVDNGCGMDANILRNVWMVIATDFRTEQRQKQQRTPMFNRFPLGEKGLGRWSVHKLGEKVRLITRKQGGDELVLDFNWEEMESGKDLADIYITLQSRPPETFIGKNHGTKLEVSSLRESWTRGEVRRLHRAVNSLRSPFKGPDEFDVILSIPQKQEWLDKLLTVEEVHECAVYYIKGELEDDSASYTYTFNSPENIKHKLSPREVSVDSLKLSRKGRGKNENTSAKIDLSGYKIGRVEFEFRLFDRDPAVLRAVTSDIKGLRDYLTENGGIRVYRDGIRVYDFGEPGNDWLNLDSRRVNTPTARTSNSQILGALRLDAATSGGLREKSNREGFIEDKAYELFREAVLAVLTDIEAEKSKDQKRLREVFGKGSGQKLSIRLTEVREILEAKGVLAEVEPRLKEVEKEIEIYRDQLLHAAVPGLTLGAMLHGAEKILDELRIVTRETNDPERIKLLVERLYKAMRPITNLLKNPGVAKVSASTLIKEAIFSAEFRLKRHGIQLINPKGIIDFKIEGSKQMLIASITNLLDNSIHWLEIREPLQKILYLATTNDLPGGPAIIVADNGPGFGADAPEDLITPFFSRRNGGMGLGLYIVNEVMKVSNANLIFPEPGDVDLPSGVDGAVVALQFPKTS